jgi:hypothetical protein
MTTESLDRGGWRVVDVTLRGRLLPRDARLASSGLASLAINRGGFRGAIAGQFGLSPLGPDSAVMSVESPGASQACPDPSSAAKGA